MVLSEVVGEVEVSFLPVDSVLSLFDAVLDPVELHIHGLGSFYFRSAIGKTISGGIIGGQANGVCLLAAQFLDLPNVCCLLAVVK